VLTEEHKNQAKKPVEKITFSGHFRFYEAKGPVGIFIFHGFYTWLIWYVVVPRDRARTPVRIYRRPFVSGEILWISRSA
jgi:hypothetical protein